MTTSQTSDPYASSYQECKKLEARLQKEREDEEKRARALEEARKVTITEDKSLPAATCIQIHNGKDYRKRRVKVYGWVHRLRRQGERESEWVSDLFSSE